MRSSPRPRHGDFDARLLELARDSLLTADVISVDTDVGSLLLHADDLVMTPAIRDSGCWEADEAAWMRSVLKPGNTALDIGANIGYFTVLLSHAVGQDGHVIAVEPEHRNLRLLSHNLWRNRCDNVRVVPAAAWCARATLALRHNFDNAGDHQVHPSTTNPDDVLVPAVALDDVVLNTEVHAIKIDTQGADHEVIVGLERTLQRNPRAPVLTEFWLDSLIERNVSPTDVLAQYRALKRPIGLLSSGGAVTIATDQEILAAAQAVEGHWVNLVLGAR